MNNVFERVSPTKMTFGKMLRSTRLHEGSNLNLNIDRSGQVRTERPQEKLISFKKSLSRIQEYQPEGIVWTLVITRLSESVNAASLYDACRRRKKKL